MKSISEYLLACMKSTKKTDLAWLATAVMRLTSMGLKQFEQIDSYGGKTLDLEKTTTHMSAKQKKFIELYAEALIAIQKSSDSDELAQRRMARCLAGAETIVKGLSRKAATCGNVENAVVVTLMRYFVCMDSS